MNSRGTGWIKLSDAAAEFGCHVETLRERVRAGLLEARRGPHGAYYVTREGLDLMPPIQRPLARTFAPDELEETWIFAERLVGWSDRTREAELDLLRSLKADPTKSRRLYRLVSVQRLQAAGLTSSEIAREFGITARHVRRLAARSASIALRKEIYKQTDRTKRARQTAARTVVAEIRRRLKAAGFVYHKRSGLARLEQPFPVEAPDDPRQAFVVKELKPHELRQLRAVGLTDEQLRAIDLVGIGTDELNYLLLHGLPAADEPARS